VHSPVDHMNIVHPPIGPTCPFRPSLVASIAIATDSHSCPPIGGC
jgi:hypothetical protein